MQIDYEKIVMNALSTLVAAVFVGAAAIVWQKAMNVDETVDDRLKEANQGIISQWAGLEAARETLADEVADMKGVILDLEEEIQDLKKSPTETTASPSKPITLKEPGKGRNPEREKQESDRLIKQIDIRQMEIYDQRIGKRISPRFRDSEIQALRKSLTETTASPSKPIILKEPIKERNPEWEKQESDRLIKQIDTRQMEIYDQRMKADKVSPRIRDREM